MGKYSSQLNELSQSLHKFISEFHHQNSTKSVTAQWSVKDVLCHLTYWHKYYAENLSAQAKGEKHVFSGSTITEINRRGVDSLKSVSTEKLIASLQTSQKQIEKLISDGSVSFMQYRAGIKPYTIEKFLHVVTTHIQNHTKAIANN